MDAASLASQISQTLMGDAPAPSAPVTESAPSIPSPSPAPESTPTPQSEPQAEPVAHEEEEFSFPDETPAEPSAEQAAADAQPKPDDELGDLTGKLPKDIQEAFLKTERGKKLYLGFKLGQELRKPVEQGGLGGLPTIERIKEAHQDSQDLKLMTHEFHHGDPSYAQNWVKQWFQPGPNGYSAGARQVASQFVPTLAQMAGANPQAAEIYKQIATPAVMNYIEQWYQRAEREMDPTERVTAFNVARLMEMDMTGKYRPISDDMLDPKHAATVAPNPQQTDIDRKIQFINQFEQNRNQQAQQTFETGMNTAIFEHVSGDVKAALGALSGTQPKGVIAAIERQFIQDVYARVNERPAELRNFIIARDQARSARTPQAIKAAADAWRSVARPVIRQLRAAIMAENGDKIMTRSAERHATLDEASQKRGTTGVAQPGVKNLAAGPTARQPGESHEDFLYRITSAAISA